MRTSRAGILEQVVRRQLQRGLFLLAVGLSVNRANAYCRTTTCSIAKPAASCLPPVNGCDVSGIPLSIKGGCMTFSVNEAGSPKRGIKANVLQEIVTDAFNAWQSVDCGAGLSPSLSVDATEQVSCDKVELSRHSTNQNLWTFVDKDWLSNTVSHTSSQIALTTVQFLPSDGYILGVDVELNSDLWNFATESFNLDAIGTTTFDLRSVVQHESGHFLGLAHSNAKGATLAPNYPRDLSMRTLESDDKQGICEIYQPGRNLSTCDATPLGGFSKACAGPDPDPEGCCAIAARRHSTNARDWSALLIGGIGLSLRRKCAQPSRRNHEPR